MKLSPEHFAASLPPPLTWNEHINISETIRRDLKLAVDADVLPADARSWVRETSCSPVISVEIIAWPGAVLAEDYAAAVMDGLLANREIQHARATREVGATVTKRELDQLGGLSAWWSALVFKESPPQDARLSPEVNEALALVKTFTDRRIAEVMETQPVNYYGLIQYRVEIISPRLIAVAERGLRLEVDPEYAEFMHRARCAALRLSRRAVRSICGEGGVDLSGEQELEELVTLDTEARGRPVVYSRQLGRWEVAEEHAMHKKGGAP